MRLIFDLDGTICFDGMTIAPCIREALLSAQDNGHEIIFASARSYRDCLPVIGEKFAHNYVVALNGGLVYHQGQVKQAQTIQGAGYQFLIAHCHQYDTPYFVDNTFHYSYHRGDKMPFISFVDALNLAKRLPVEQLANPIKMVLYLGDHLEMKNDLLAQLAAYSELEVMYHEEEQCLYINPQGVTKASTLVDLFDEDYICFGNDKNDIDMFQHARYAIQIGDYAPLRPYADEQLLIDDAIDERIARKIMALLSVE
ncbi:HAD family hydrolase [Aerococcaceae bacterium NML191292]|nr:HAD family hydrolase [Aerococcaceae bacterium NML191292]